ncbi:MAG: hypothetical protein ACRDOK_15000 [Streptosporangiaceae bacterium]
MTYQPYPTGAGSSNIGQQGPRPSSVRTAVILMYVGAGLSALALIGDLALSGRIKAAVGSAERRARTAKPLTATQIHAVENAYILIIVVVLLVAIGMWVWMAWANGRGRGWARILSSVFFGLNTILLVFFGSRTLTTAVFVGLGWLAGLAALIFLWRRDTTQYIAQSQ